MNGFSILDGMTLRQIYSYLLVGGLFLVMVGCQEEIEIPGGDFHEYDQIYMPQAVHSPNRIDLTMADSIQPIIYGASFGGYGYPSGDIQVLFDINESLVDSFNQKNGTNYPILPLSSYTFSQTSAIIQSGEFSTPPLTIKINPQNKLELFKEYLLPVTILGIDRDYKVNENLKTAYFVIQAVLNFDDFLKYDRSGWSVFGVSSEEPHEGPVNGGTAISAIDGDLKSFWHTKWVGGFGSTPHWIAFDMGEVYQVHGISFYGRQNDQDGKPKDVLISVSNDGNDWVDIDHLQLAKVNSEQQFFVKNMQDARYLKITILSNYGNTQYTHLAEVYLF